MPYPTNGAIVPKSSDSPALPPNFKIAPTKKDSIGEAPKEAPFSNFSDKEPPTPPRFKTIAPPRITMLSLHYELPEASRVAVVLRDSGYSKLFPNITATSARRLTTLAADLVRLGYCDVSPSPGGWYAHVDRAVYPPPITELGFHDIDDYHCTLCRDTRLCKNCDGTGKDPVFKNSNCWICSGKTRCTYCCGGGA